MGLVGYITSAERITFLPMYVTDERKLMGFPFLLHTPREITDLAMNIGLSHCKKEAETGIIDWSRYPRHFVSFVCENVGIWPSGARY